MTADLVKDLQSQINLMWCNEEEVPASWPELGHRDDLFGRALERVAR